MALVLGFFFSLGFFLRLLYRGDLLMVLMPPPLRTETKYKMVIYTAERKQNSTTILSIQVLSSVLAKFPLHPALQREVCTNLSHVVAFLEAEQQKDVSLWKKIRTPFNTCRQYLLPTLHL